MGDNSKRLYCEACNASGKHNHFPVIRIDKVLFSIKQAIDEAAKSQEETIREVSSRYASLFPLIKYLDTVTLQVPAQDLAEHPVRYQIA